MPGASLSGTEQAFEVRRRTVRTGPEAPAGGTWWGGLNPGTRIKPRRARRPGRAAERLGACGGRWGWARRPARAAAEEEGPGLGRRQLVLLLVSVKSNVLSGRVSARAHSEFYS